MEFSIIPYDGVGLIKLGMRQDEIHQILNSSYTTNIPKKTTPYLKSDFFDSLGIWIGYGEKDLCKNILLTAKSNPKLLGRSLLKGKSIQNLFEWLKSIDNSTIMGDVEVVSFKFGICLLAISTLSETCRRERPKEVVVFERGFYDYLKK